ncbi:uncharacterized protein LOC111272674 isoform X1 [Varroa jacobsoni]|uniref:uncharacterized protein LOC111272674 isoform X1 n=2 Tax=Varroa jacobsoni TaxID=62625 RepID=UPI000BF81BD2|nr:uncharacterized protein LOC111272674 isoform X1 [Varroa jacobsoni]
MSSINKIQQKAVVVVAARVSSQRKNKQKREDGNDEEKKAAACSATVVNVANGTVSLASSNVRSEHANVECVKSASVGATTWRTGSGICAPPRKGSSPLTRGWQTKLIQVANDDKTVQPVNWRRKWWMKRNVTTRKQIKRKTWTNSKINPGSKVPETVPENTTTFSRIANHDGALLWPEVEAVTSNHDHGEESLLMQQVTMAADIEKYQSVDRRDTCHRHGHYRQHSIRPGRPTWFHHQMPSSRYPSLRGVCVSTKDRHDLGCQKKILNEHFNCVDCHPKNHLTDETVQELLMLRHLWTLRNCQDSRMLIRPQTPISVPKQIEPIIVISIAKVRQKCAKSRQKKAAPTPPMSSPSRRRFVRPSSANHRYFPSATARVSWARRLSWVSRPSPWPGPSPPSKSETERGSKHQQIQRLNSNNSWSSKKYQTTTVIEVPVSAACSQKSFCYNYNYYYCYYRRNHSTMHASVSSSMLKGIPALLQYYVAISSNVRVRRRQQQHDEAGQWPYFRSAKICQRNQRKRQENPIHRNQQRQQQQCIGNDKERQPVSHLLSSALAVSHDVFFPYLKTHVVLTTLTKASSASNHVNVNNSVEATGDALPIDSTLLSRRSASGQTQSFSLDNSSSISSSNSSSNVCRATNVQCRYLFDKPTPAKSTFPSLMLPSLPPPSSTCPALPPALISLRKEVTSTTTTKESSCDGKLPTATIIRKSSSSEKSTSTTVTTTARASSLTLPTNSHLCNGQKPPRYKECTSHGRVAAARGTLRAFRLQHAVVYCLLYLLVLLVPKPCQGFDIDMQQQPQQQQQQQQQQAKFRCPETCNYETPEMPTFEEFCSRPQPQPRMQPTPTPSALIAQRIRSDAATPGGARGQPAYPQIPGGTVMLPKNGKSRANLSGDRLGPPGKKAQFKEFKELTRKPPRLRETNDQENEHNRDHERDHDPDIDHDARILPTGHDSTGRSIPVAVPVPFSADEESGQPSLSAEMAPRTMQSNSGASRDAVETGEIRNRRHVPGVEADPPLPPASQTGLESLGGASQDDHGDPNNNNSKRKNRNGSASESRPKTSGVEKPLDVGSAALTSLARSKIKSVVAAKEDKEHESLLLMDEPTSTDSANGGNRVPRLRICEHISPDMLLDRKRFCNASLEERSKMWDRLWNEDRKACETVCQMEKLFDRFDCNLRYSVRWSCRHCQDSYREWTCAMQLPIFHPVTGELWKPCRSLCTDVEERCPHFHPIQGEAYAGEPLFYCIDPNIPEPEEYSPYASDGRCYLACWLKENPKARLPEKVINTDLLTFTNPTNKDEGSQVSSKAYQTAVSRSGKDRGDNTPVGTLDLETTSASLSLNGVVLDTNTESGEGENSTTGK